MTDRLPVEAVEALVRWKCSRCGDLWKTWQGAAVGTHVRRDGAECEGGPVIKTSILPPGTVIVVGEDGQVACRTQEEAARVISDALWLKEVRHLFSDDARRAIAALSATDTGKT